MKKIMFNDRYGLTQAVLEGRKTMTRRMVKVPKRFNGHNANGFIVWRDIAAHEVTGVYARGHDGGSMEDAEILPSYKIGELVAVAQSYKQIYHAEGLETTDMVLSSLKNYAGWNNKMFTGSRLMPHRIRITDVRVERLHDISDEDCLREGVQFLPEIGRYYLERTGCEGFYFDTPREAFASLIDKVSGYGTWQRNPWVFVYEFELIR